MEEQKSGNFAKKDIKLSIDGMGIVMYSPKTVAGIPEGYDYFHNEYALPKQVAEHIKKGDMVGFCTGSGGEYTLKIRKGYPSEALTEEYPLAIRLGIDVQDDQICFIDLFWLTEWYNECPLEQTLKIKKGYYHITLLTRKPETGRWGDHQVIYVFLNRLPSMPELTWTGIPLLVTD